MSGLIWIQIIWHADGISERIFRKHWFWKKSADDIKAWKNYPGCKELIQNTRHFSSSSKFLRTYFWDNIQLFYNDDFELWHDMTSALSSQSGHCWCYVVSWCFIEGTLTRGHVNRFLEPYCIVNAYKYYSYPSSIRDRYCAYPRCLQDKDSLCGSLDQTNMFFPALTCTKELLQLM